MRGRPGRGAFRTARPRAGAPAVRPERPAQSCLPAGTWSTVACVLGVSNGGAARRERVRAGATIWRRRTSVIDHSSTACCVPSLACSYAPRSSSEPRNAGAMRSAWSEAQIFAWMPDQSVDWCSFELWQGARRFVSRHASKCACVHLPTCTWRQDGHISPPGRDPASVAGIISAPATAAEAWASPSTFHTAIAF